MTTYRTFCRYHIGDQLVHLNFLHRLTNVMPDAQFVHVAPHRYLHELRLAITGVERITLEPLETSGEQGVDAWCGSRGWWYAHPERHDWAKKTVQWFQELARRMGVPTESPIESRADLAFQFPALKGKPKDRCRVLLINSQPHSNQFAGYNADAFDNLFRSLGGREKGVVQTQGSETRSLVEYGRMASEAELIVGVSTGPMWLTYHERARGARRVWLNSHEHVSIFGNESHATSIDAACNLLWSEGWL